MVEQLSRREARAILRLDADADEMAVKRAYRRRARELHPDAGGDAATFHRLQAAYELLVSDPRPPPAPPKVDPARRPTTPASGWSAPRRPRWDDTPVDLDRVDWEHPRPEGVHALDRTQVAVATLADPDDERPVSTVVGRSRGPRSILNRFIAYLDPELLATFRIAPAAEQGAVGHDVELRLRFASRKARRRADNARFPDGWVRRRGSTTTTVLRLLHPSHDPRATALRVADELAAALESLDWPLPCWYAVPERNGA